MRYAIVLGLTLASCVYPRRSTSLSVVRGETQSLSAPSNICSLTVVGANITPRKPGDLAWDEGEGLPDPFARVYRNNVLVWESPTLSNTLAPEWNATLPQNLSVPPDAEMRFEAWDSDTIGNDPIGSFSHRGLPDNAVPGADARLMLPNGSFLTIRVTAPTAHRGVGIPEYEVHPDSLVVIRVQPDSPASRADIEPGNRVVSIGGRRVSSLDDASKATALSMAQTRDEALEIMDGAGHSREVHLDSGYIWLSM